MSLVNFLNAKLKPSVECQAVSEENYEAQNLISENPEVQQRGFIGYVASKPPAEIVFFFPKAIDLKILKLWNSQGALRSTAFEIFSKHDGKWEKIGYVRDLEKGVDIVTFCHAEVCAGKANDAMKQEGNVFAYFFKSAHKLLAHTSSIKVTIRATHKCVPVLQKAQAWGLPSRKLDKADRELVMTIWREIVSPCEKSQQQQQQQQQQSGQRSPTRCVPELAAHSKLNVPEEFLDAITWEIMIFPTILPSGKVVDQSTIDRHSEVEALWGRMPSDPFTGLDFTAQRKAILDVGLKMRIEKFLTENSEQFKAMPRTVGSRVRRSKNRHASQFANALCTYSSLGATAGTYSVLASSTTTKSRKRSPPATITHCTSAKQMKRSDNTSTTITTTTVTTSTTTYPTEIPLITSAKQKQTLFTPATASATLTSLSTTTTNSNSNSVESALQQALQRITSYTRLPAETKSPRCINCKSEEFSYKIQTCRHLVCRECLTQLTIEQICVCKTSFRSADVERYHKL